MEQIHRTSVQLERGFYITRGYYPQRNPIDSEEESTNVDEIDTNGNQEEILEQVVEALTDKVSEQGALKGIPTTDEIIRDIENGTAVAVSDGSFKGMGGTAAWIVDNSSGSQRIMGNVNIPGTVLD